MKPKFFLFLLVTFLLSACGGSPSGATSMPTSIAPSAPGYQKVSDLIESIYTASDQPMQWEEIPAEGIKISTYNYFPQYTYEVKVLNENEAEVRHLHTNETFKIRFSQAPEYSIMPLLYTVTIKSTGEKKLAWSGVALLQKKDGKYFIEKSLTILSDVQLKATIDMLEKLKEYLQSLQNG